jgi:hypothetical protein
VDRGFRVEVLAVTQEGKDATFINPLTGLPETLHDRPPLVLDGVLKRRGDALPITVVVNHHRSLGGVDDPADGERVRAKRQAQAEFLANYVQGRQTGQPNQPIVLVGDFNGFEFNDGYVDVMGTIRGNPAPANEVVAASPDLVHPNLFLVLPPPAERYSFIFDGNGQSLDHALVNARLLRLMPDVRVHHARIDADFPEVPWRNDPNSALRISDHDPLVLFLDTRIVMEVSDAVVTEGDAFTRAARFLVSLNRPSRRTVSVNFATLDGTAKRDEDYLRKAGTLFFDPGVTAKTIRVPVIGDTRVEPDETFQLVLSKEVGARLNGDTATGTIVNDD